MALLLGKTKFLLSAGKSRGFATISFSKCGNPAEVLKSGPSSSSTESVAVGTVKVAIKASAVQVEDVRAIRGLSLMSRKAGVAGTAGSGVVTDVAVGEGHYSNQDSVLVLGEGVWSDEVTVSKEHVVKVAGLSHEELASLPSFLTAWGLLHNFAKLNAGDVVVQTNGSTAVGSAVVQLGKALGLKIVSLADSDIKGTNLAAKLQEVGAYKLAICGQSGRHVSSLQRHVARGGATVAYNGIFEPIHRVADVQLPISHMIFHDSSVYGFDLLAWSRASPGELQQGAASILSLAKEQKVSLKPTQVLPQADFLKAVEEVSKTGAAVVLKH